MGARKGGQFSKTVECRIGSLTSVKGKAYLKDASRCTGKRAWVGWSRAEDKRGKRADRGKMPI